MENKRIFELLRLRVPYSYGLLPDEERGKTTFFKESVDALENLTNFFEDVRSHRNPILEKFLNTSNEVHGFDQDTYLYFSKLLPNSAILPNCGYKFRQRTTSTELMECIRNIQNTSEYFLHLGGNDPYAYLPSNLQKRFRGQGDKTFPTAQIVALKNLIKENQTSIDWNVEFERRRSYIDHMNLCADFDHIIKQNLKVNVLCLDINLKNSSNSAEHEFIRINLGYITKIQTYLNQFPNFLNGFFKWESDHQHGLNLHCILFFKGERKLSPKKVVEKLTDSISRDKFDSGVAITNWLNLLKKITRYDFTRISYHQTEHIHQFQYWILGYYAYIDHIIQLDYRNNVDDSFSPNGDFLRLDEFVYYDPLLAYQRNLERWKKRIEGKDSKKVWQYRNLPIAAIERIEIAQLIYEEYACVDSNFKGLVEVGVRLEIFIENVLVSFGNFFDFPRQFSESNPLTEDEWASSITPCCQQYFSLIDEFEAVLQLLDYSQNSALSPNLNVDNFGIRSFFLKNKMDDKFNLDLNKIFELNNALAVLRDRYIGNSVHHGRLKNRINSKHLEMNKISAIEAQYKICARRYVTSIDYLNAILVQDVVVYRIQFILDVKAWGNISQEEFSKLFTNFIRFGKRAQPLSKCIGYLGCWTLNSQHKTIADVLFFFSRSKLTQVDGIARSIIDYWHKFLKIHFEHKSNKDPQKVYSDTESIAVFSSQQEFNSKFVIFDAKNRKKQNLFKQTVIKYLAYNEIFQPRPVVPIRKVLIKGSKVSIEKSAKN
ncbi:hypothetical protein [Acinetobacter sp. XH1639]|uniref:hypothetical protein n=1 Tax=Acinetobacter sp. XH1639 TaxID=3157368 RepID=UPI0032B55E8C